MPGPLRFPIGTAVAVRPLARKRGEIIDARDGRYRVRVDGVTVTCRETDLEALPDRRQKKPQGPQPATNRDSHDAPVPAARVDLHGLTAEAAIERVIAEIDRSLLRGADRLEIVHGKGSGKIRAALHRQLAALPAVKSFTLDAGNEGVTWAYF